MEQKNIDVVDISTIGAMAIIVASSGTLAAGIPAFLFYLFQHHLRRSQAVYEWATRVATHPIAQKALPSVIPGPTEETTSLVPIKQANDLPFWKRATLAPDMVVSDPIVHTAQKDAEQIARLKRDIRRLPAYINYTQLPKAPSSLSVPLGMDAETKQILWVDFGNNADNRIIHALIAGQTGAGKDALLRLWYTYLTYNNSPDDIKFVIIDGKIDWLSPALAQSPYMAIAPAGGVDIRKVNGKRIDCAKEQMANSLEYIFEQINYRQQVMSKVGAVDLASYYTKTGIKLPHIFFIASDVGETFDKELDMLINLLIMKGRAYGIRMVMSMQNPVGESTKWRSQVSLIMSGHQGNADHDRYVLGINVNRMLYRPSMIPNPEENDISKGLFVVRRGSAQHLVRTPHLPEEDWFSYIEQYNDQSDLLTKLLTTQPTVVIKKSKGLTKEQIQYIVELTMKGNNKTEIMYRLGVTNGTRYKELSPKVDLIMGKVKERLLQ